MSYQIYIFFFWAFIMLKNIAISLSLLLISSSAFQRHWLKKLQQKFKNIQSRVVDLNKAVMPI